MQTEEHLERRWQPSFLGKLSDASCRVVLLSLIDGMRLFPLEVFTGLVAAFAVKKNVSICRQESWLATSWSNQSGGYEESE